VSFYPNFTDLLLSIFHRLPGVQVKLILIVPMDKPARSHTNLQNCRAGLQVILKAAQLFVL